MAKLAILSDLHSANRWVFFEDNKFHESPVTGIRNFNFRVSNFILLVKTRVHPIN